jgi:hypothetical protein
MTASSHPQDVPGMHPLIFARRLFHAYISIKKHTFFCTSENCSYIDYDEYYIVHDYLDHIYYIVGYLDIDITATSTTQLHSIAYTSSIAFMTLPDVSAWGRDERHGRHRKGTQSPSLAPDQDY